jgi:leucyl/phenylalanyl-tRNA--protein transferase
MIVLRSGKRDLRFPPVEHASPEGLLALGGDLSSEPILWWSPDPRAVLYPDKLKISRSLRKTLRQGRYQVRLDTAFREVMLACAAPRHTRTYKCRERHDSRDGGGRTASGTAVEDAESDRANSSGTWINDKMVAAYCRLYDLGHAHSVETWRENRLMGGLYGVALGGVFFGESMFSRATDASKVALVALTQVLRDWGFCLIDCQVDSKHLASLGAETIPRTRFISELAHALPLPGHPGRWQGERACNSLLNRSTS